MKVAIIGFGGIGQTVARSIQESYSDNMQVSAVLVREKAMDSLQSTETRGPRFVSNIDSLLDSKPDVVAECAGHTAVQEFGKSILAAGIDLVVVSAGALADEPLHKELLETARENAATLYVPAGALAGIDGITAARYSGLAKVRYTGRKPPAAWTGTPAEDLIELDHLDGEKTIFTGNARDAALLYPKNSNVAAVLALAGLGFEKTEVHLIADSNVTENQHQIDVEARTGRFQVALSGNTLPGNDKTSALAAFSAVKCIVDRQSILVH